MKRSKKYHSGLITLLYLLINCYSAVYASNTDIKSKFIATVAIVDIHAILEHSIAIRSIRKSFNQISKKIHQDLVKEDAALKEIDNLLIAKRDSLSRSAFEQEVSSFNKKVNIVKKERQNKKNRLEQAHADGIGKVQETITQIINSLAEKYGINLVIPSTQILFAKNNLNITQEVIVQLNNKLKHVIIEYK